LGLADAASVATYDDEAPILFLLYCCRCLQLCLPSVDFHSTGDALFSHITLKVFDSCC
jgi:hypothetical protein